MDQQEIEDRMAAARLRVALETHIEETETPPGLGGAAWEAFHGPTA